MKQPLTPTEYQSLLLASAPRWRDTWRTLRGTGLRVGELTHLRAVDVSPETSSLTVTAWGGWKPKTRTSARTIPLGAAVLNLLIDRARGIVDTYAQRLYPESIRSIQLALDRCAGRAGLRRDVSPHLFRHTYAFEYMRSGGTLRGLMALLGHGSLAVTGMYLRPDEAEQRRVLEAQAV